MGWLTINHLPWREMNNLTLRSFPFSVIGYESIVPEFSAVRIAGVLIFIDGQS
jgi:hypothetical protein